MDLLWNGGIGTYVKASTETHADVGDRSNDAVRIDAPRLRAQVVAEGGNLGLTQAARIEYALAGGLVNTDFIDNSAGVDTSDHEVNIKILLQEKVTAGELTAAGPERAAAGDDRRGRRPGAAGELPAEPGAGRGPRPGGVRCSTCTPATCASWSGTGGSTGARRPCPATRRSPSAGRRAWA